MRSDSRVFWGIFGRHLPLWPPTCFMDACRTWHERTNVFTLAMSVSIARDRQPGQPLDDDQPGASTARERAIVLASAFGHARVILRALTSALSNQDMLIVVTDARGFPLALRATQRPSDLPVAIVVGRHPRCSLSVRSDDHVSLRHLLLTFWPGAGPTRIRGYDLGARAGIVLADGRRVPGFSAQGHVGLAVGNSMLFVLPGGQLAADLLDGSEEQAKERVVGLRKGIQLGVAPIAEPEIAQLVGYRGVDPSVIPDPAGALQLVAPHATRAQAMTKELEIDRKQLQQGLLIGRYSDRCSLAVDGRNLSRVHALVTEESRTSLLVYDLASTNGVRPYGSDGSTHAVVRLTPREPVMLGHFELRWNPPSVTS